jgi:hypothetical protein
MGGLKPWHLGIAGCVCLAVVLVIVAVVYLVRAAGRK